MFRNAEPEYFEQLSSRDLRYIDQFTTPSFSWPTSAQLGSLDVEEEHWGVGSRFYKLAAKYYGDVTLWWIIPWFNKVPLESDFRPGDVVLIPVPLERILKFF